MAVGFLILDLGFWICGKRLGESVVHTRGLSSGSQVLAMAEEQCWTTATAQGKRLFPWRGQWGGCLLRSKQIVELRLRQSHDEHAAIDCPAGGFREERFA